MTRLKSQPALLVIDMQNGFCHKDGSFSRLGLPVDRHEAVIPRIRELLDFCRSHRIPVFFTLVAFKPDYSDAGIVNDDLPGFQETQGLVRDTWDAAIVDQLQPQAGEVVISKTRNNAFWGTDLAEKLQARGIDQIIATGVGTNVCVESTVREARSYGIHALTVSDGTATLSEEEERASLLNLKYFGGTITRKEVMDELRSKTQA